MEQMGGVERLLPFFLQSHNEGITPSSKWYYLLVVNLIMKVLPLQHQSKTEHDVEIQLKVLPPNRFHQDTGCAWGNTFR
jgi:hypothetical protein